MAKRLDDLWFYVAPHSAAQADNRLTFERLQAISRLIRDYVIDDAYGTFAARRT
jgi:hypothetical protein